MLVLECALSLCTGQLFISLMHLAPLRVGIYLEATIKCSRRRCELHTVLIVETMLRLCHHTHLTVFVQTETLIDILVAKSRYVLVQTPLSW